MGRRACRAARDRLAETRRVWRCRGHACMRESPHEQPRRNDLCARNATRGSGLQHDAARVGQKHEAPGSVKWTWKQTTPSECWQSREAASVWGDRAIVRAPLPRARSEFTCAPREGSEHPTRGTPRSRLVTQTDKRFSRAARELQRVAGGSLRPLTALITVDKRAEQPVDARAFVAARRALGGGGPTRQTTRALGARRGGRTRH